jgi:hypothetical protein
VALQRPEKLKSGGAIFGGEWKQKGQKVGERKKPRKFTILRFLPLFVLFVSTSTFSTSSDFKTAVT